MITENTVFILGAGASCPYGYPTGQELRKEIIDRFVADSVNYFRSQETRESIIQGIEHKAKTFVKKFELSSTKSIDLFLSRHPKHLTMGKYAIIFRILVAEDASKFREQMEKPEQDWYSYLFNRMTNDLTGPEDYNRFSENNLSFVTFNYDRSLEHIFYESLLNSFSGSDPAKAKGQIDAIKIIHVFGRVGPLEWQSSSGFEYKWDMKRLAVDKLVENLRIIHEENDNPELDEARKLISEAPRIFFLGFGFAKENLEILQIPEILNKTQQIYGTALGFKPKEINDIRNIFPRIEEYNGGPYEKNNIKIHDIDCLALLREYL